MHEVTLCSHPHFNLVGESRNKPADELILFSRCQITNVSNHPRIFLGTSNFKRVLHNPQGDYRFTTEEILAHSLVSDFREAALRRNGIFPYRIVK